MTFSLLKSKLLPMVYLPEEVDLSHFALGKTRRYGAGPRKTKSIQLLYENDRFVLQTPVVFCPFGIVSYKTSTTEGWALAFNPDADALAFFDALDKWLVTLNLGTYVPLVRRRDNQPPLIRFKLIPKHLGCGSIEELRAQIPSHTRAQFLLQLLPIWISDGKYGTSFRFRNVCVIQHEFQNPSHPETVNSFDKKNFPFPSKTHK